MALAPASNADNDGTDSHEVKKFDHDSLDYSLCKHKLLPDTATALQQRRSCAYKLQSRCPLYSLFLLSDINPGPTPVVKQHIDRGNYYQDQHCGCEQTKYHRNDQRFYRGRLDASFRQ